MRILAAYLGDKANPPVYILAAYLADRLTHLCNPCSPFGCQYIPLLLIGINIYIYIIPTIQSSLNSAHKSSRLHLMFSFFFPHTGVTDSKAVKGSSSMLDWSSYSETASPSHILVIVSGIAAGLVLTVLLVCLFVTCRRKVSC